MGLSLHRRIAIYLVSILSFNSLWLGCFPSFSSSLSQASSGEDSTLLDTAVEQLNKSQWQDAIFTLEQVLKIRREIKDRAGEAVVLGNIGNTYRLLGAYEISLKYYQEALDIFRLLRDTNGESTTLNDIGVIYKSQGKYDEALQFYQEALAINHGSNDRDSEGITLNNIGEIYRHLGNYSQSIDYYRQGLAIFESTGNLLGEAAALHNLGLVYDRLGQYNQSLEFYQLALALREAIKDRQGIGATLNNIGLVYDVQHQYDKALEYYQKALAVRRETGDRPGEGITLNNIGLVNNQLGQYSAALTSLEQSLTIFKDLGDRASIGNTIDSLGTVYKSMGDYAQSLSLYQKALGIFKEVGDRAGERNTLSNIAALLEKQEQIDLAIVFYKQAVNITEAIRQDLRTLPREQQQSYTEIVAELYRRLADLLLKQNRVLEAQKVLDLLKVQEIDDYLHHIRGNQETARGITNLPPEDKIIEKYTNLQTKAIAIGQELAKLEKIPEAQRTSPQQQRILELRRNEQDILREFNNFIESPQIIALVAQLNQTARGQNVDLEDLNSLRDNLPANSVLFYPVILEDRLELVIATPNAPPTHHPVAIKREEFNRAIAEFRSALTNPTANAKIPAHRLYELLIKPIEDVLSQTQTQTIIYAPDGQLRYIPLSALYDGKEWLVERYRINNITAKSLTDFHTQSQSQLRVLAAAFTQGSYQVKIRDQEFEFAGLPFAGKEVAALAATVPNTTQLLDHDFSPNSTVPRMNDYSVVHLATHAVFVSGQPEDSFILFGDGNYVTLSDIKNWSLKNVDLVVLSACETGLGGELGNGEEILGFGYQIQRTGAKAAIASLWSVDDGGTQVLMNSFYDIWQKGNISKVEALREAQIALIHGNYSREGQQRGLAVVALPQDLEISSDVVNRLSHPYYWAAFILIGNGF